MSPLMQALEQTDLGNAPSPLCGIDDSSLEMVFVCGIDGTNPEKADAIEKLVLDVLLDVAENGVPKDQIDAVAFLYRSQQLYLHVAGKFVRSRVHPALGRGREPLEVAPFKRWQFGKDINFLCCIAE